MTYISSLVDAYFRLWFCFAAPQISGRGIGSRLVPMEIFVISNIVYVLQQELPVHYKVAHMILEPVLYLLLPSKFGVRAAMIATVACCLQLALSVFSINYPIIAGWHWIALCVMFIRTK